MSEETSGERRIETRLVSALRPHPDNERIYGDSVDDDFVESIRSEGITAPLLVTRDNVVISGHRRLEGAKRAGLSEVPVIVFGSDDELSITAALIHSNKQRVKTNEQVGREMRELLRVESERAKRRMMEAALRGNVTRSLGLPASPEVDRPVRASSKVGEQFGKGKSTVELQVAVVNAIDKLAQEGKSLEAEGLRSTLNSRGPSPAHKEARERGYIVTSGQSGATMTKTPAVNDEELQSLDAARAERKWTEREFEKAVDNIADERVPQSLKDGLLAGTSDPVSVRPDGDLAVLRETINRRMKDGLRNDPHLSLQNVLIALADFDRFDVDEVVECTDLHNKERYLNPHFGLRQYGEKLIAIADKLSGNTARFSVVR